jgi:hypothetical protein
VLARGFAQNEPARAEFLGYFPADAIAEAYKGVRRSRVQAKRISAKTVRTYISRTCKELEKPTLEGKVLPRLIKRLANMGVGLLEDVRVIYLDYQIDLNLPADDGGAAPPPAPNDPGAPPTLNP